MIPAFFLTYFCKCKKQILPVLLFIGVGEVFFILLIVLLFFGAESIPEIARGLGKGIYEIKRATQELKSEITRSAEEIVEKEQLSKPAETFTKIKEEIEGAISRKKQ